MRWRTARAMTTAPSTAQAAVIAVPLKISPMAIAVSVKPTAR